MASSTDSERQALRKARLEILGAITRSASNDGPGPHILALAQSYESLTLAEETLTRLVEEEVE